MRTGPRQPFWGEIKQVQLLMVLLSCLSEHGKLREILQLALEVPKDEALANMIRCPEVSVDGLREWLPEIWAGDLSDRMVELVKWQNTSENMTAAIRELIEVQDRVGITLSIVRRD